MNRLAAAGTAAQRSYTCIPCLRILAGLAPRTPVSRNTPPLLQRSYVTSVDPPKKQKGRRKRLSAQKKSGDTQHCEASQRDDASQTSEKSAGSPGEWLLAEKKGIVRRVQSRKLGGQSKESSETKLDQKSKKEASKIEGKKVKTDPRLNSILQSHRKLRSDLRSMQTLQRMHRSRKTAPSLPSYQKLLQTQRRLSKRITRLEGAIGGAMDDHFSEDSQDRSFLSDLSKSLSEMAKKVEELVSGADAESDAAGHTAMLSGSQHLRQGQALRQIINVSQVTGLAEEKEDDVREGTDSASAVKTLLTLIPPSKDFRELAPKKRAKIHKCLGVLVPNVPTDDYAGLIRMLAQHVEEKAKVEDEGKELSSDSSEKSKGVPIEQALRSEGFGKRNTTKPSTPRYDLQLKGDDLSLEPIHVEQPPVRGLAYGLDRVLFNPGVYLLQDQRSKMYNFDPYLEKIMPVQEFNFDLLQDFITSSEDKTLQSIAHGAAKKYTGSSSSMTGVLSQFHYLLSKNRSICSHMMSRAFNVSDHHSQFTEITKAPAAIFLRWKEDQGLYAIDSDKEHDETNVLSLLGNSLERLLTLPKSQYEKFRVGSEEKLTEEEQNAPETYHYTGFGDILMRSQLDAYDPRLPGTGMFDLKTRAVLPVRMHVQEYLENRDYEIRLPFGNFESFEREWMDMMRATMVKYMLQVRIGRMDGIFIAYHNTQRIFGFQYAPLEELDLALHGQRDRSLGDEEFKLSVKLMNEVLNKATERFPKQTLRIHAHTSGASSTQKMRIFVEPFSEEEADKLQSINKERNKKVIQEIMSGLAPSYDDDKKRIFAGDRADVDEAVSPTAEKTESQKAHEDQFWSEGSPTKAAEDTEKEIEASMTMKDEFLEDTGRALERQLQGVIEQEARTETSSSGTDSDLSDGVDGDIASMAAQSKAPLLAMELRIENYVNGNMVQRPGLDADAIPSKRFEEVSEGFSKANGDSWTVGYEIKEIKDRSAAWQKYLALRRKRQTLFGIDKDRSGDLAFIMRTLRTYVDSGREYRKKKDEEEASNSGKTMLGDPRPRTTLDGTVETI